MVLTQISEPVATPMETKLQQVLAATQNPENRALLEAVLAETRQLTAEKRANPFNSEDFYDNAPVGYHSANAAGIIIRANKTLLNMLGYTAAEVIGKMSISHLLDAESRAFFNAHFSAVVKMEFKLRNQELTYVRKDGSTLPILLNVSIIKDANGNFFATHSAITNIAKEKERENELNSLYNSAPCGYYSVDENRMVNRINDTLLSWLGYTRGEVVGQSAYIFIVSQDSEYTKQRRAKLDQGEMVQEAEYFIRRKDGSVFTAILNGVAIKNVTDGTFKIQVVVLDITEHSHLQNELKVTSEQLFQANEDKNKFIGIASHDLQNPITSVLMATELLQKTTQHPTPMQIKLFGNIKSAANRMNYLVSNMLSINRIERGMVSDDWRTVSLKSLVWDIASRNQIFAARKNIRIHQFANDETDWNIFTEPNYLTQAVENLIGNAIKFSHKDKNLTIEVVRRDTEMDIVIADEGQGIKEEELPKLFGRFQKLSARPTGNEVSTGLGLSVSKEFIDVLQGRIGVKSIWGVGTTFTVTLPLQPVFEKI